jgi:3-dehydroquinate dehydratase-2
MKKILIVNGPNLNLLGKREPSIYGHASFDDYLSHLKEYFKESCSLSYYQSNHEGELIDKIHEVGFSYDGIVLNAGAYTHTSIALHDAIKSVVAPVIEVHISNIHAREEFRHKSFIARACIGSIIGLGLESYKLAINYFIVTNNTSI